MDRTSLSILRLSRRPSRRRLRAGGANRLLARLRARAAPRDEEPGTSAESELGPGFRRGERGDGSGRQFRRGEDLMKKWKLWLLGYATMFLAGVLAFVIMTILDGGYWTFAPLILWFVLMQIFVVPKILRNGNRK